MMTIFGELVQYNEDRIGQCINIEVIEGKGGTGHLDTRACARQRPGT